MTRGRPDSYVCLCVTVCGYARMRLCARTRGHVRRCAPARVYWHMRAYARIWAHACVGVLLSACTDSRVRICATKQTRSSGVAQWLACWAHNPKVRGSKPRSAMSSGHPERLRNPTSTARTMIDPTRPPPKHVSCGARTHAQLPAVDLKSTPLTTRAN